MLIDSHCHLPHNLEEAKDLIDKAEKEGVVKFINIGTSIRYSKKAIETAEQFKNVYATVAVYPHDERGIEVSVLEQKLSELADSSKKVVAIGECGFDAPGQKEKTRSAEAQAELFEMQIKLALEKDLPIIIHNRDGDDIVINLLKKYQGPKLRGVAHCYASTWETAQKLLDLGFYISFSGMITYPSRRDLLETVEKVPEDRFLVETDAPYLPPQGHRGEINQPKYVKIVAQKVAEVRKVPLSVIESISFSNTSRLFNL
jgi:TatD DNase family protein